MIEERNLAMLKPLNLILAASFTLASASAQADSYALHQLVCTITGTEQRLGQLQRTLPASLKIEASFSTIANKDERLVGPVSVQVRDHYRGTRLPELEGALTKYDETRSRGAVETDVAGVLSRGAYYMAGSRVVFLLEPSDWQRLLRSLGAIDLPDFSTEQGSYSPNSDLLLRVWVSSGGVFSYGRSQIHFANRPDRAAYHVISKCSGTRTSPEGFVAKYGEVIER